MRMLKIALASGDGAAPEMMREAVLCAAIAAEIEGVALEFVDTPMGWSAFKDHGDTFPRDSFKRASDIGTLFFGGVGEKKLDETLGKANKGMKPEPRCLLGLRGGWKLLLNFRPVIYFSEIRHLCKVAVPHRPIEQHWIRFLLEDSYFGNHDLRHLIPNEVKDALGLLSAAEVAGTEDIVSELAFYSRNSLLRYFRFVFHYAADRGLPVFCVSKSNMMGRYVLWQRVCEEVAREFPHVPVQYQYVDTVNMMLFRPESLHGVIACGNEHGDILTDGAAECWGSMGMMHSASINPETRAAMFESGAGTAPDLAGKDIANPLGRILTAGLMLRHLELPDAAAAIEGSVRTVLAHGHRTRDIARIGDSVASCSAMGKLVRDELKRVS